MPRTSAEVTVRSLAPDQEDEDSSVGLYRPVQQLEKFPPDFKVRYVWFTPEMANEWLKKAQMTDGFRQRPLALSQVRRWRNLIQSKRMVHFLPNQPICVDEHGVAINGQHRLTGLAGCREGTEVGFMVIEKVPRWMFAFFDTNRGRTIKDVFHIGNRVNGPQTPSTVKLAMRYEEFITGRRAPGGWRHWNTVKDEHQDYDEFYARRGELHDWYQFGERLKKTARIMVPSAMVFAFYQSLAWPDGDPMLHDFMDMLTDGTADNIPQHPVRKLREWTESTYIARDQIFAKRETHLLMLFQAFNQVSRDSRIQKLTWAYGQPMTMPYHPEGFETAIKNVRQALQDIDRAADEDQT